VIGARVKHFDGDNDGLGDFCGDCDPNPNDECLFFSNTTFWNKCIYDGDIVQLPCGSDTSAGALQVYFEATLNNDCLPCDALDDSRDGVIFKRPRANIINRKDPTSKRRNAGVCYTIDIVWEGCIVDIDFNELTPPFLTATLEIVDAEFPVFTVPPDITVDCDQINDLSITGNITDATDNCGIASITYSDDMDVSNCILSTPTVVTRLWAVEDECGNGVVSLQQITVNPPSNCDGVNLNISSTQSGIQEYNASNTIQSSSTIQAGADIKFFAGQSITLTPNFHAKANSNFLARIRSCTTGNASEVATRSTSSPSKHHQLTIAPNPFAEDAMLTYELATDTEMTIRLYNARGQLVQQLLPFVQQKMGIHQLQLQRQDLTTGIYFIQLQTNTETVTRKVLIQ
jgi:hypothetical protein